jgi:hypothetical protein
MTWVSNAVDGLEADDAREPSVCVIGTKRRISNTNAPVATASLGQSWTGAILTGTRLFLRRRVGIEFIELAPERRRFYR